MSERNLCLIRLRFLDLFKSFFVDEPDAERMGRWRGTFSALAREQVSPGFDDAVRHVSRALWQKRLADLQGEYYYLFVDPFGGGLTITASALQADCNGGQPLDDIRELMAEAGLRKNPAVTQPEDSLVVMLDSFASLVEEEKSGDGLRARLWQGRLLEEFLHPLAHRLAADLRDNAHADFYTHCCRVLCSYLDMEKGLAVAA